MPDLSGAGWMAICVIMSVAVATVSVSAYCNNIRDVSDPLYGITASGAHTSPGTLACGPSLPFGTLVYIPGYGWGVCRDRGGAITDAHLDIFWASCRGARDDWGRQVKDVLIVKEDAIGR